MNIVKAKLIQLAEEEQKQEENKEYTFDELNKLCSLMGRCKNTPCEKGRRGLRSAHKKDKKSKN